MCYYVNFFIIAPRLKIPIFAKNQPKIPKNPLKKHFFTFIPFYFAFRPVPTVPPPPQVYQSGLTIRGNSKKWTYDGKNVASVVYVVDNSQICIERYNRTLGTLTSVDVGGNRVWSLLGEDETERAPSAGLGLADALWGENFITGLKKSFKL